MEHRIETELGRLAVFEQGSGPAVFLWPSLYLDHHSLDALVAELAAEWRCVTLDGPGHGQSPGPARLYDLAACARAAARVLDALGVEATHWVGNAWGGHVGVRAAVDFPERIRSLAVLAAPLHPLDARMRFKTRLLLALLGGGLGSFAASALAGAMLSPRSPSHLRDAVRRSVLEAPRTGLVRAIRSVSLGRGDLVPEVRSVHCPMLFLAGADDPMYPPARAAQECALIAGARFVAVEAAAHLVPMEQPQETAALLRSHLSSSGVHPDAADAASKTSLQGVLAATAATSADRPYIDGRRSR